MVNICARGLKDKLEEVVFVGGSVMELYINDPAVNKPRATVDVDVVVEIVTRVKYNFFENELRNLGFVNDIDGHIGRFSFEGVQIDVIATNPDVAGFTNIWYEKGYKSNFKVDLGVYKIKIFPLEYYIASKFEAYKSRGTGSPISSHDLEDIIYLFDGIEAIEECLKNSEKVVKEYLRKEIETLLLIPNIKEIVTGHLGFGSFEDRTNRILSIFKDLTS